MKFWEGTKRLTQGLLDLVFPIYCLGCGRGQAYLCQQCLVNLPKLAHQLCLVCQTPSPFGKTHESCASRNKVDGAIAALDYKNKTVKKIIEVFKYNFVADLASLLARTVSAAAKQQGLDGFFHEFVLLPVPLHARRFNWRGFNQSGLLARELSELLSIPVDETLAARTKHTNPQTKLNLSDRQKNIANAFTVSSQARGKKILIVDDVITSGATINELAKALKRSGAAEVWALCVAHG